MSAPLTPEGRAAMYEAIDQACEGIIRTPSVIGAGVWEAARAHYTAETERLREALANPSPQLLRAMWEDGYELHKPDGRKALTWGEKAAAILRKASAALAPDHSTESLTEVERATREAERFADDLSTGNVLTKAQRRCLELIAATTIRREIYSGRYYSTRFPPDTRSDVVARMVDRGLATVAESCVEREISLRVLLTDAGREALAADHSTGGEA